VGVAAAGTAKDLQVLSTGTLKFVAAAGAAGIASVGLAGTLGVGLGAAFAGVGVAAALMNKNVRKEFKDLGQGLKNQLAADAKPVQDTMLGLVKYIRESLKTMQPVLQGFFKSVAPLVDVFGKGLVSAVFNVITEFQPLIKQVLPIVREFFNQIPDLVGNLAAALHLILAPLSGNTKAFGTLLQTIGSLLPIVGSIIGSLVRLGQQIMPAFQQAILGVGTALDSGLMKVLPLVGKAINQMLPAIGHLAGALFPALAAILRALLPVLSSVVAALAGALAKVLPQLVPAFVGLIQVVGQLLKGLQPLLPSLVYLAVWISKVANNLLSAIIPVVTALLGGLVPALKVILPIIIQVANQVGNALAVAFKQAAPSLVQVAKAVGQLLIALAPLIPVVVTAALAFLPIIPAVAKIASVLAQGLVPIVLALTPLLVFLAPTLVKLAVAAKLYAVAQGILNVVLAANPIGIVIVALIALAAWLVHLWKTSETFRNIVTGSFNAVKRVVMDVWNWVKRNWPLLLAILTGPIGAATILIIRNWNNIKNAAVTAFTAVVGWFRALPGRITGAIGDLGRLLTQAGRNLISGLWSGIKAMWDTVVGWFKGLPSKILGALGIHSPPDWAISAGKHVMGGILKGLAHGAADVAGFFKGLASSITGPLASIWAGITAPGGPAGYATIVELAQAMVAARWGMGQWPAFNALEMREAGYNPFATNPSSGAFGIPQALPPSKLPPAARSLSVAGSLMNMAAAQLQWMLGYISDRYGNPAGAWAHEQAFNWYAGGMPPTLFSRPTLIGVGEAGPETVSVLPGRRSAAVVNHYHVHINGVVGGKSEVIGWLRQGLRESLRRDGKTTIANQF
jgi:phage-related protein